MEEPYVSQEDIERINRSLVFVTNKACKDCPLFYNNMPQVVEVLDTGMRSGWKKEQFFECVTVTLGEQLGKAIPEFSVCYSFFYLYAHENIYLEKAIREERIRYIDVSNWPGIKESGRSYCSPYIDEHHTARRTLHTPYLPEAGEKTNGTR